MENNLSNAFLLFMIGMVTVFVILFIVVTGGNILIKLINKIDFDITQIEKPSSKDIGLSSSKEAVIQAVVSIITDGKGKVDKIEKI